MFAAVLYASLYICGALAAKVPVQPASRSLGATDDLPLTVISTSPAALSQAAGDNISLDRREDIQVVYSRAVVPLGSDGAAPPTAQTPFTISGGGALAGTFRWLNSYVASFEPANEAEWGTDLTLDFAWNRELVTFDGVPLSGAAALEVRRCARHWLAHVFVSDYASAARSGTLAPAGETFQSAD